MVPRLAMYGATSTALAAAVVGSALHTRANFFAAAVAVGMSSGSLMILANFCVFVVICIGIVFKLIFFGQLRSIEYEHLFERLWMFITESLLALTMFRNDFSGLFLGMYGLLLFLKCFHWITADRVDYLDQVPPPGPPFLFHLRATTVICTLVVVDFVLMVFSLESIAVDGVSAMVLFASEFAILLTSINGTLWRYAVGLADLRRARGRADAPTWEKKSMYLFYIDLGVDFAKLLTYLAFFTVILLHYGLPLHILRDVYMTLRSFVSRCGDLIRYRQATRDMDAMYPSATAEEMDRLGDRTCIICREELVVRQPGERAGDGPNDTPKKLSCGHVFHFHCLRSWLERQQSCPTCRRDVLRPQSRNTRGPARPVPPAAPQPGAVPRPPHANGIPPNAAANPPNAANPANPLNPLRDLYHDFFRFPGENRPAANAAPAPAPAPQPAAGNGDASAPILQNPAEAMQTGIWGGPITPGQFFKIPLGAAPRPGRVNFTSPQTTPPAPADSQVPVAGPSTSSVPDHSSTSATSANDPSPPHASEPESTPAAHTPASSNPPEIFASSTQSRVLHSETDARRLAAEAALRRTGKEPEAAAPASSNNDAGAPSNTSTKGKERATAERFDDPPRVFPFLSNSLPAPHPVTVPWTNPIRRGPSSGGRKWDPDHSTIGVDGLQSAVGERLKVLRDVDEVIWGLVGELTRLKSEWDTNDTGGPTKAEKEEAPSAAVSNGLHLDLKDS